MDILMLYKHWLRQRRKSTHRKRYAVPTTRKHTSSHTVSLYTAVLGEVTVCLCPQEGRTALHLAAQEGKVDVVRRLLTEAQALVNIQTKVHTPFLMSNDWSTACILVAVIIWLYILCWYMYRVKLMWGDYWLKLRLWSTYRLRYTHYVMSPHIEDPMYR